MMNILSAGDSVILEQYEEFQVTAEAEDGEMALELARQEEIDVYLVDINMPFVNGLQFIEQLRNPPQSSGGGNYRVRSVRICKGSFASGNL